MTPMRIEIIIDRQAARRWHERLRARLLRLLPGSEIRFRLADGAGAFPPAVVQLLMLERLLLRRSPESLCDNVRLSEAEAGGDFQPTVILDCTGRDQPPAGPDGAMVFRPLYNGQASEVAAAAALLAGSCPSIALENFNDATLAATGLPSLEAADGLASGLDAVASRVITLIEKALLSPASQCARPLAENSSPAPRGTAAYFLRGLAHNCARRIYHLCCHSPHWRVGWRFNDGPGVLETGTLSGPAWRALPDLGAAFAADPFPIVWQGRTFVFLNS